MTLFIQKTFRATLMALALCYGPQALASDTQDSTTTYFPFSPPTTDAFYVNAGVESYSLNILTHRLPMTIGDWFPSVPQLAPPQSQFPATLSPGFEPNNTATQFDIGLGYILNSVLILPTLFSHERVEFDWSQFNRSTKNFTAYSGAQGVDAGAIHGVIWQITDSSAPIYDGGALRIVDSNVHASLSYKNAELYLKGEVKHLPGNMKSTARVGLIATNFNQVYNYTIESTTQGITQDPKFTIGNDTLYTQYVGFAFGDRFDVRVAPAFSLFVDGVMQILYVDAALVANETPDTLATPNSVFSEFANNVRVSDYNTSMSYRAKVSAGVSFYPGLYKPNTPKVSLGVGVDQWGYVPQEVTITGPNAPPPHIVISSMRNYFAALSISVPLS
jgi:hypothetical protein